MREYLQFSLFIMLIGIGSLLPKTYLAGGNATQALKGGNCTFCHNLTTAYEYIINLTTNATTNYTITLRISNYLNHSDASKTYTAVFGSNALQPGMLVPPEALNKSFDFAQFGPLELHTEFYNSSFALLAVLSNNSIIQILAEGKNISPNLPLKYLSKLTGLPYSPLQLYPGPGPHPESSKPGTSELIELIFGSAIVIILVIVIFIIASRRRAKGSKVESQDGTSG